MRTDSSRCVRALVTLFVGVLLLLLPPLPALACSGTITVTPMAGGRLPTHGPTPGTELTVTGSAFGGGPVVVRWGALDGPVLGRAVADDAGGFTVDVVVPTDTGYRPRIVARSSAGSSGMPTVGWLDLAEPASGGPGTPDLGTEGPSPASPPIVAAVALAVFLGIAALIGAALLLRRHRRHREALTAEGAGLDGELEVLLDGETAVAGRSAD